MRSDPGRPWWHDGLWVMLVIFAVIELVKALVK